MAATFNHAPAMVGAYQENHMFIILAIPRAIIGALMWFKGTDRGVPEYIPSHCKPFPPTCPEQRAGGLK